MADDENRQLLDKVKFTREEYGFDKDEKYYDFWQTNGEPKKARDENIFGSVVICCCPKLSWC